MNRLNYHHLYYFWRVAKEGNLTKAANLLHVSQSALSSQIKQLENTMNIQLFVRAGRKLVLTEAGIRSYAYADDIFKKGEELEKLLLTGTESDEQTIRIGVLSTMSRNFIELFIEPFTSKPHLHFVVYSSSQAGLLDALASHQIDLMLTNVDVVSNSDQLWQCQLLARQAIAVIGPENVKPADDLVKLFSEQRWVLPVTASPIRSAFDSFCTLREFKPKVAAEADDMAMLRLLARDTNALAVLPEIVVKDELKSGKLKQLMLLPNVFENFYAVTVKRQYSSPAIAELFQPWLSASKDDN